MPLSPEEVDKQRLRKQNGRFLQACDSIDRALAAGRFTFAIGSWPADLVARIKQDYEYVGWKVDEIHDQRDGDYLRFSVKKKGK